MKKVLLAALLCFASAVPLQAQYHITGDTIQYYDSIYWVPQWFKDWVAPVNMPPNSLREIANIGRFSAEVVMKHVTDRPIRIIGIAGCVFSIRVTGGSAYPVDIIGPETGAQEYFLIYCRKRDRGDVPARSVPWSPNMPHRFIDGQAKNTFPPKCDSIVYGFPNVKRIYEVYFEDNPLVITDSFFIGMTQYSDTLVMGGTDTIVPEIGGVMPYGFNCGRFPDLKFIMTSYRGNGWDIPAGQPVEQSSLYMWYFFPILSQDTDFALLDSCPAAGNVWFDTAGGGSILRWEADSLHVQWRVGIGDTGTVPDSLWLDTLLETPFLDLAPLGIAPPFSVQVRPQCLCYEYYNVWGNWGDCVVILPPEPDTCRPVTDLQYLPSGYGQGTLVWTPDTLHTLWQVAIGDTGTVPEQAWLDTLVASPILAIDSLSLSLPFTAHVRARCGADPVSGTTFNWSPWSEGLFVDPLVGLTAIPAPAATLHPNPASGMVTVAVPDLVSGPTFRLKGVEVYSLTGSKVLALTADAATEISFDVSSWPPATYLVVILTPAGRSVKRLVVQ